MMSRLERVKLVIFINDMIIYIEKCDGIFKKAIEMKSEFNSCRIWDQYKKGVVFLCTSNEQLEIKIKNTIYNSIILWYTYG